MGRRPESPFASLESAHEFVTLLCDAGRDAKSSIAAELAQDAPLEERYVDALRIACYNLDKLDYHLRTSLRILNDLRSLRRLLTASAPGGVACAALPASPVKPQPTVSVSRPGVSRSPSEAPLVPRPPRQYARKASTS